MSKRKSDVQDYKVLHKKLKEIEKQIQNQKTIHRRRIRVLSSSSSSSEEYCAVEQHESHNTTRHEPGLNCTDQITVGLLDDSTQEGSAAAAICNEDVAEEELDDDILQILGVDPSKNVKYGNNILKEVAVRFEHMATAGLPREERKVLTEKYLIPENCKLIGAPILNTEIKAALSESIIKRDKSIAVKQNILATAISSLGKAITSIISSKEKNNDLLETLIDTGRALCDCQNNNTVTRRNFILFSVKKELRDHLQNTKIDDFLFGNNLSETLKAAKAINKSGSELKFSTPKPSTSKQNFLLSKNWKGTYPPRKQPQKSTPPSTASPRVRSQQPGVSRQSYNQRPVRSIPPSRR